MQSLETRHFSRSEEPKMSFSYQIRRHLPSMVGSFCTAALAATLVVVAGCGPSTLQSYLGELFVVAPASDPRVGLRAAASGAREAGRNLHVLWKTKPAGKLATGI